MAGKSWTTSEDEIVSELFPIGGSKRVREVLTDRTISSIRNRAKTLKVPRGISWSEEEDKILKEFYFKKGAAGTQKLLPSRTKEAIHGRAQKIGISVQIEHWSEAEIEILYEKYPTEGIKGVHKLLPQRTPEAIKAKAVKLKIASLGFWSEEEEEIVRKYFYSEGSKGVCKRLPNRTRLSIGYKATQLGIKGNKNLGLQDISGELFGNWTEITYSKEESKKRGASFYRCICSCGRVSFVHRTGLVKENPTSSCGHCTDIYIGEKINRLEVLCKTVPYKNPHTGDKAARYICLCECGNYAVVRGAALRDESTKSCGCLQREKVRELCSGRTGENSPSWKGEDCISPLKNRVRDSAKFIKYRDDCFKRDNYTCRYSGEKGIRLNMHHIEPEAQIWDRNNITTYDEAMECEELWDLNKVITLAEKNHLQNDKYPNAFHSIYSTTHCTATDFRNWFLAIRGE